MMYYNKINTFIINIIDIINNDKILINYILISLGCLFILDCNIIYKKIKKEEKFSFIYIIKINITLFLSLIILLFSYDLLFNYNDILLNNSFIQAARSSSVFRIILIASFSDMDSFFMDRATRDFISAMRHTLKT